MSVRVRRLLGAALLTGVLAVYVVAVGGRALTLVRTGEPVAVALGLAVGLVPALVVWLMVREWQLATTVDAMTRRLEREGGLEVDDLPRSPGGRVERAGAAALFDGARRAAEADPTSWPAWFRLAWAYDAAGDRKRARAAMRQASRLYRAG